MRYRLQSLERYEEEIKRSRFLVLAQAIDHPNDALEFIARHAVPEATHNCWAYRIGQEYRFNDDGEPGGTAGRPILQAIDGQQCDQVVVLVIRWFGGVKLGTGGLMRAYGGTAAQCLRLAAKSLIVAQTRLHCHVPYTDADLLRSRLEAFNAKLVNEDFGAEGIEWTLSVPSTEATALPEAFINLSSGRISFLDDDLESYVVTERG